MDNPPEEGRYGAAPKISQNRNDSSPAADTTVLPSGLQAKLSTREVWPVNSWTRVKEEPLPYFHKISWFSEKPWELQSSRWCLFQRRAQTCDPVSIEFIIAPLFAFHSLMVRSAVPPPLANIPRWKGHQSNAFTAALCWRKVKRGKWSELETA